MRKSEVYTSKHPSASCGPGLSSAVTPMLKKILTKPAPSSLEGAHAMRRFSSGVWSTSRKLILFFLKIEFNIRYLRTGFFPFYFCFLPTSLSPIILFAFCYCIRDNTTSLSIEFLDIPIEKYSSTSPLQEKQTQPCILISLAGFLRLLSSQRTTIRTPGKLRSAQTMVQLPVQRSAHTQRLAWTRMRVSTDKKRLTTHQQQRVPRLLFRTSPNHHHRRRRSPNRAHASAGSPLTPSTAAL